MTEAILNYKDKLRLRSEIKISMVLGLLFSVALVVIVLLIPGVMFFFDKRPSEGFVTRGLFIVGHLLIPFLAISWKNILKYLDLIKGKKLLFKTVEYEIFNIKDKAYILIHGNINQKISIDRNLVSLIKPTQPLTIEITILAKSLLFISHNEDNLLDKINID